MPVLLAGFLLPSLNAASASSSPIQHTSGQLATSALAVHLTSVLCTSQQRCVGVGGSRYETPEGSIAAVSSDGGAHWASSPLLVGVAQLSAMACSSRTCIAVGWNPVGNDAQGVVIRTLDGGHTWRVVPILPKGVGMLSSVSCPTATFCMAVGESPDGSFGVALVTNNSGQRWKSLALPKGERGLGLVTCTTRRTCIAQGIMETITGVLNSGQSLSIITTADSGSTWTQSSPPEWGSSAVTGFPIFKGMECPSPTRCLMVGDATPGDGSPSGVISLSADGGKTWTIATVPPGTTFLNAISCASPTDCVVVGGGIEARGGTDRDILTTTDGGQTWISRPVPTSVVGLSLVSCPTIDRCVAMGGGLTQHAGRGDL